MSVAVDVMQTCLRTDETGRDSFRLPPLVAANDPILGGGAVVIDVTVSERTLAATCGEQHSQNFPNTPEGADRLRQWGLPLSPGLPPVFRVASTGEHYAVVAAILHVTGARVALTLRAYIGVDVSKDTLDVCWDSPNGELRVKVANDPEGIDKLHAWASALPIGTIPIWVMESTGSYHQLPAAILQGLGHRGCVCNPTRPRYAAKAEGQFQKTDRVDALMLSRFGRKHQPREWTLASPAMVELRAMSVRMMQLVDNEKRERSRLFENPRVTCWLSVCRSLRRSLEAIKTERKELTQELKRFYRLKAHAELRKARKLLQSVPGIGPCGADHLLCLMKERGLRSAGEAAALLGVVPIHHRSGTSVNGKPRISGEGDARARSALYMGMISACTHRKAVKARYEALQARGLAPKQARIAIMNWVVRVCYAVLRDGKPYDPNRNAQSDTAQ